MPDVHDIGAWEDYKNKMMQGFNWGDPNPLYPNQIESSGTLNVDPGTRMGEIGANPPYNATTGYYTSGAGVGVQPTQNDSITSHLVNYQPAQSGAYMPYQNPTQVTQSTKQFGEGTGQFNVDPFMQPFNYGQQRGETANYLTGLTNFIQNQESMPDMYARLSGQLNLPSQREQYLRTGEMLGDVTSQMLAMPESIQPTAGATMTEGQRQRALASELEPIQRRAGQLEQTYGEQGARLASGEEEMGRRMAMEVEQQKKMLLPWEKAYDSMNIMQAREFSGYTFSNQMELDRLIKNQQAGLSWTDAEATRAHELALQEQKYDLALRNTKAEWEHEEDMYNNYWDLFT